MREGHGYTVNIPFPPRVGDLGYSRVMNEIVRPKVTAFAPDLILVSAGFDAHWQDPLAMAGLSLTGFTHIMRDLKTLATELCDGHLLFVLEGGYHIEVLCYGVVNAFHVLLGEDQIIDPFGPQPYPEANIERLLEQLKRQHLPF